MHGNIGYMSFDFPTDIIYMSMLCLVINLVLALNLDSLEPMIWHCHR